MKKLILILFVLILSLPSVNSSSEKEINVERNLVFNIFCIEIQTNFVFIERASPEEAKIYFGGIPYEDSSEIPYRIGDYSLSAWFIDEFKFLLWYSSEDIIIENRFSINTRAILTGGIEEPLPTVTDLTIYSHITLVLLKGNLFLIPYYNNNSIIFGNLNNSQIIIKNKINNEPNFRFLPFENIKIYLEIALNESKPNIRNFVNASTYLSLINYIFNNNLLIKKENQSLKNITVISWEYTKEYEGLVDVEEIITHVYPDSDYELGFSNRTGQAFLASYTLANITWSWCEISYRGYECNTLSKILFEIRVISIYISSALATLEKVYDLGDEFLLKFRLLWVDDLELVLGKSRILAVHVYEMKKSLGESDNKGYINFTLTKEEIAEQFWGISGHLTFIPHYKGGALLEGSIKTFVRLTKLSTVILSNDFRELRIKIIKLSDFSSVRKATIELIIDGNLAQRTITDENGEALLYINRNTFERIEIRVKVEESDEILLNSEFSDIIVYSKIWP